MSTLGKVLLVFVFLSSLGMFYLAARTLATLHHHRTIANDYEKLRQKRDDTISMIKGTHERQEDIESIKKSNQQVRQGLLQVNRKLNTWFTNRGRVWFDCVLLQNNGGQIQVQVPQPNPHGINGKNVLYVFEQAPYPRDEHGNRVANRMLRYLGDFTVDAGQDPANPQVNLTPAKTLTPRQMQYLNASPAQGQLVLYEQLPIDIHEVWTTAKTSYGAEGLAPFFDFSGLDPQIGQPLLAEFQRHGEAANADDPPDRILLELKFLKDAADLNPAELQELRDLGFNVVGLRTPAGDPVLDKDGNPVNVDIKEIIKKDTIAYFMKASPDPEKPGPGDRLVALGIAQQEPGGQRYHRPLRDYGQVFRDVYRQIPQLQNRQRDLNFSLARVQAEEKLTIENQKNAKSIQAELLTEQGTLTKERSAVLAVQDEYERQLALYKEKIEELDALNLKLAAQLKTLQLLHAARINREAAKVRAARP